ncbi:MAG: LacI family DNA-binding transcriptional regulator [Eubacterium sp.]
MSIKEIAQRAGVSQSTVSRVLNNPEYRCSTPEKRDMIWQIARELDYVPNESARNLKMGVGKKEEKNYYISILLTRTDATQTDPFFTELLHVIETEIHRNLCIFSNMWYDQRFSSEKKSRNSELDAVVREMAAESEGKCDGLIVVGKCSKEALKKLKKHFKNIVAVNRNPHNQEVDEIVCDGRKIATKAVEHLISLGHKNIGYVGECHNESRYKGFTETLEKHDIELIPEYVMETKQTEAEGFEVMNKFLHSDDMPTGIYCANDITAVGMLKCLKKSRNRYFTPSIISSDDIEEGRYTTPMLTTIGLPKEEMGKFALNLLLDRIKGEHKSIVHLELEGRLINRESCVLMSESSWNDYII